MHHSKAYMYINIQRNQVVRSIKTVHTNLFAKQHKLHKFATCNSKFEKSHLSDMHYSIIDIQANFGINRHIRYQITAKIYYLHRRQTDRRRDRQMDGQTSRSTTIGSFFENEKHTKNRYFGNFTKLFSKTHQIAIFKKHFLGDHAPEFTSFAKCNSPKLKKLLSLKNPVYAHALE